MRLRRSATWRFGREFGFLATLALGVHTLPVWATDAPPATDRRSYRYEVPLDPDSPWPKFRRDERQTGRSPVLPRDSGGAPWVFRTGKGVFSSPVIDGDGTIYIGSADRTFYAISSAGALKWKFPTGEIIDSAALLDDQRRVIFGSGDGHVYALDRSSGEVQWSFRADTPELNSGFINWFEGNVAIGPDGTLYAPNDNFCTYALRRSSGERVWCFETLDQTWSLPAIDPTSGRLFIGNNFAFLRNLAALDPATGRAEWRTSADGSVAASPLLTTLSGDAQVVVGGFDGYLRAYDPASGRERWRFGARDHLYASPAEMADATIIQPSADGSIYAISPSDGSLRWAFDTREPIRSSPAIDGAGNIYVGSGEGRLFVLDAEGSLRWSIRLIDDSRDDLNASPALGSDAIVLAGENGGVFSVPYDYCLRPGLQDPRCTVGEGERMPSDGVFLSYTTPFGRQLDTPPASIDANQPLAFSLRVRRAGDTQLALIDSEQLRVTLDPPAGARVDVSGDRKFITLVPQTTWTGAAGGSLRVQVQDNYLVNPERSGLRFTAGESGGGFDQTFVFAVQPHGKTGRTLQVPQTPGDRAGVWELYRLAAPLPTILPSYNQIGFDSIHYLIGLVEGDGTHAVAWAVGGRLADAGNRSAVDPHSRVRFPLAVRADGDLLSMTNEAGFTVEFNGFPLPFQFFRVSTRLGESGAALYSTALNAEARCGEIDFYGGFLQDLGYCNPNTDLLDVFGAAELRPYGEGTQAAPAGVGTVHFEASYDHITATFGGSQLRGDEHNVGLLVIDAATGRPLPLPYANGTAQTAAPDGTLAAVSLSFPPGVVRGEARVYAMVDTYPAAVSTLRFPTSVPWHARITTALGSAWSDARRFGEATGRRLVLKVARKLD